ncbi:MAG: hypothetical protein IPM23_03045 [Candidatus Melainabacteria bacterium]|nr:hypothetical protein [Candidatus Melainabacteria bacterium]
MSAQGQGSIFEAPINEQFRTSDAGAGIGGDRNPFTDILDDIQKNGLDEGVRQLRDGMIAMGGGEAADPVGQGFPPGDSVMDMKAAAEKGDANFAQANQGEVSKDSQFAKLGAVGAMMMSELSPENQAKQRQTELHWAELEKNIA